MKHPSGVRLQLRRKDCISSIALVDAMNLVWLEIKQFFFKAMFLCLVFRVCGWKQKEHPMLYNALHIGDQLISIEGVSVSSASDAHKILRSNCFSLYVSDDCFVVCAQFNSFFFLLLGECDSEESAVWSGIRIA